jgi:hypothetical protein
MGSVAGRRYQKPIPNKKFLQQSPNALIVINDKQMGIWSHTASPPVS